jgi:hypothetical protein
MIIKKHKNKNSYIITDGVYVRDFTTYGTSSIDVNKSLNNVDQELLIDNSLENYSHKYPSIDNEDIFHSDIVIVSDGYNFKEKQDILAKLSKKIIIIAVNGALKEWRLVGENAALKRVIDYYLVNNPYVECMQFMPSRHRYYPKCICSIKTNPKFLKEYQGLKYIYSPTENEMYSGADVSPQYRIDDYRNPVCAAIGLAYRFHARKILLFCCDGAFDYEKPTAVKLDNELWQYPQHELSQKIIDANCYWLKTQKIEIADYSSGRKYENVSYITNESDIVEYFKDE